MDILRGEEFELIGQTETRKFLSNSHLHQWMRMVRQSTRRRETLLNFLFHLLLHIGETASLIFSLVAGFILPTKSYWETLVTVILHVVLSVVYVVVSYFNDSLVESTHELKTKPKMVRYFFYHLLTILKPIRFCKAFTMRKETLKVIKNHSTYTETDTKITLPGLKALSELHEFKVEDKRLELYETFMYSIPISLIQTYFLFANYQVFLLCDLGDLSRIAHIGFTIFNAAKCVVSYEQAKSDYFASLHFISFFQSKGANPMRLDSPTAVSITRCCSFVYHLITLAHRYYMYSYFLSVSVLLSTFYLMLTLLVNIILEWWFSKNILCLVENPPYGVHTKASRLVNCYIGIFSTVNTRYHKFSRNPFPCFKFHWPVSLLHFFQFVIPVVGTFYLSHGEQRWRLLDSLRNVVGVTTKGNVLQQCPDLNKWYMAHSTLRNIWGDWFFESYSHLQNRFTTMNSLFNQVHVLWLLGICQIVSGIVHAYAVKEFELQDHFPILLGYSFWKSLIDKVFTSIKVFDEGRSDVCGKDTLRKLMVFGIINEKEFHKSIKSGCCKGNVLDETMSDIENLTNALSETDEDVEKKIREFLKTGHEIAPEVSKFAKVFCETKDRRLMLLFVNKFNQIMDSLDSRLIEEIFGHFNIPVSKAKIW